MPQEEKKQKESPGENQQKTARTTRPAGASWRKRGRWWERRRAEGSAAALAVRVARRGHEVSEQYCSQLEPGLRRARGASVFLYLFCGVGVF